MRRLKTFDTLIQGRPSRRPCHKPNPVSPGTGQRRNVTMASDAKGATSFEEGLKGASEKVAEFHEDKGALKRLQTWLHQTPSAVPMMRMSGVIRLCSWAVIARPALTTAMIAERLGLV